MKEDKSIFLKVDCVEPVLKGGGICSGETYLDGVKVWIGNVEKTGVHVDDLDAYLEV